MALAYTSSRSLDPITKDVLAKWEHVLECLARDPMELHEKIDWVMKKAMIERFMERKSLDWSSPQVEMLDLQYHDLRPDKGLYYLLERQGRAERIVTDEEIVAAVHTPADGHAGLLPRRVPAAYGSAVFGVNWDSISFGVERRADQADPDGRAPEGDEGPRRGSAREFPTAAELVRNLRT